MSPLRMMLVPFWPREESRQIFSPSLSQIAQIAPPSQLNSCAGVPPIFLPHLMSQSTTRAVVYPWCVSFL